jgi:hypothetical protein
MTFDLRNLETTEPSRARYDAALAQLERELVRQADQDLRGEHHEAVHAVLVERLRARLPGAQFDERNLQKIAQAISMGTLHRSSYA